MQAYKGRVIDEEVLNLRGGIFDDSSPRIDGTTLQDRGARRARLAQAATLWITAVVGTMTGVLAAAGLLALSERARTERAAQASHGPAVIRAVLTTAAASASTTPEREPEGASTATATGALDEARSGDARTSAARPNQERDAARRASVVKAAHRRRRGSGSSEASAAIEAATSARPEPKSDVAADPAAAPPAAKEGAGIDIFDFPSERELNADGARAALQRAAGVASGCVEASEKRRGMGVSVTFMPTGRVSSALITSGPFTGTETGGCIAKALRSAIVGAFDGPPVTVSTYLRIE